MFEKEAEESFKMKYPNNIAINSYYVEGFQDGAEFGYNKAKEEMQEQGLALQSDMDKTIEQNIALKKQIEKMKSDVMANIKWADQNKNNQMYCKLNSMLNQWEIK